MLIEKDQWENQYIQNLKDADLVAWGDFDAINRHPKYAHLYDKYWVGKTISTLKTWDLEKQIPDSFPVVVRPRQNLWGLSKDCYMASCLEEIEDIQGMIAQEYQSGVHYSTDYVVKDGKIVDSWTFVGHKNLYNDFMLWEAFPFPDSISKYFLYQLDGYTGVCNVESINGAVIEIHLRGSLQFYDICGNFLSQLPEFMKTGKWNNVQFNKTYSKVLRTRHDGYVEVKKLPKKPKKITSVQLTYEKDTKLSETDSGSVKKRFAVINGVDLAEIEKYAQELRGCIYLKEEK